MNAITRIDHATATPVLLPITTVEFVRMIDADVFEGRCELVGGVIEKMMPGKILHSRYNFTLAKLIALELEPIGKDVCTDLMIAIDGSTVRAADIAVIDADLSKDGVADAGDVRFVIEIAVTTLGRDLDQKMRDYARGGVDGYWVVDVPGRAVHVLGSPKPDGYATRHVVRFGEQLAVPGTDRTIVID